MQPHSVEIRFREVVPMKQSNSEPNSPKSSRFVRLMSGRSGMMVVCAALLIAMSASASAVWTAAKFLKEEPKEPLPAFAQSEAADTQPESENPPQTEPAAPDVTPAPEESEPPEPSTETGTETVTEPSTETEPVAETDPVTESETETAVETEPPIELEGYVVCFDPGHGYDDPGTDADIFGDWSEKDIVLDISLRAGEILEGWGVNVLYTRTDDVIPENPELNSYGKYVYTPYMRERFLKSYARIDAVVSVHCDYYEASSAISGARLYYYRGNDSTTGGLVRSIANAIAKNLSLDSAPASQALPEEEAFYITKCTSFPSLLLEIGFCTNPDDAANMMDEQWRQSMAQSIAEGVGAYLNLKMN